MPDLIYALLDPRTDEVRYIGKTGKPLEKRLGKHVVEARTRSGSHRLHWLRQEHARGDVSMRALGRRYSVCHEMIRKIIHRLTWQHVK